jgi:hypothetical protein
MIKLLLLYHRKERRKEKKREKENRAVVEKQRGRRFKLDIKNRFLLWILVYYNYTQPIP